jgi:radical SAM superfamily enzyme YgiQ (UPF0313 family)
MPKITFCYPSRVKENEGTEMLYSPLALAYLATHTPSSFEKKMVDEYVGEDLDPQTEEADLVAFSSLTSGVNRAYELSKQLRKRGVYTVIGGAHASSLPDEALQHCDTVIIGEGEPPWKEFLDDYLQGRPKKSYFGKMNISLDDLGVPDRNFTHSNYHYDSLLTSRGCPYHCSFCYLTVFKNRKYRPIPHETVLADMEQLRNKSIVVITDENFIGYTKKDMEDRKQLLEKIIERNFDFYWGCQASVNLAEEPELMDLMYRAGCRGVFMGFEAIDEESLKSVNKKHNIGVNYKETIKKIHQHKLAVIASSIIGLDNQSKGYHKTLIKQLKEIKVDFVRVFYMTAWPGTPLFKQLKEEGRVCEDWDKLRQDLPSIEFKNYSHEDIIEAREKVMRSFFNKRNVLKVIWRWLWIDTSLLGLFIKLSLRNPKSEKIRNQRAYKGLNSSRP